MRWNMLQNARGRQGFTLLELLVAVLLLAMISTMIYSVLNVGIKFTAKGEEQLLALARRQSLLSLLHRQVASAWYDIRKKKAKISGNDTVLRIVTRSPLLYRDAGLVLAVYRYDGGESTLYYTEKKDFYNVDYDDDYVPDYADMRPLLTAGENLALHYDEVGGEVLVTYGDEEYAFSPRCDGEVVGK